MCFSGEGFNKYFQEFQEIFDRMKGKWGKTLLRQKPKAVPRSPEHSNLIKGYCKVCFYGDSLSKKIQQW